MQAWKRWLNRKKNGIKEEKETLAVLRQLRMSATVTEFNNNLSDLRKSSLFPPIRSYLEKVWLPQKEVKLLQILQQHF